MLFEWQQRIKKKFFADDETLYLFAPRQNGKTFLACEIINTLLVMGMRVCVTAHRDSVNSNIFNSLLSKRDNSRPLTQLYSKVYNSNGRREIILKTGGRAKFYVRSKLNSIGDTYDVLIHDECEFMTDAMQSALTPTITKQAGGDTYAKIFYIGTAPRIYDDYTFFNNARAKTDSAHFIFFGLQKVGELKPLTFREAKKIVKKVNPTPISDETIKRELSDLSLADFYSQRLGAIYEAKALQAFTTESINNYSKISDAEIIKLKAATSERIGVKISTTEIAVAKCIVIDNIFYCQLQDIQQFDAGFEWLAKLINSNSKATGVAVDGFNTLMLQKSLENIHKRFKRINGFEFYNQNSYFLNLWQEGRIRLSSQEGLIRAFANMTIKYKDDKQTLQDKPFSFAAITDEISIAPAQAIISSVFATTITRR